MKAMILAAGKGTRVRPITYTLPKPMIPLVRKPIMESIIEHLNSYGIEEFIINTSHLAPVIENFFRDGDRHGVQVAYSFEGEIVDGKLQGMALGSAGGMKKVQDFSGFFDETFVVVCGDALVDLDIDKVCRFHKERRAIATIVLKDVPRNEVNKYGVVQVDDQGRILKFQEKPSLDEAVSTTVNTGIYMFEPDVFDSIPSGQEFDIGGDLFPALVESGKSVFGISLPFQWIDIGSVPDYWEATRQILQGEIRRYVMPGKEIRKGVRVGINLNLDLNEIDITPPVYIGSSTSIGAGVKIVGPTVIGSNCSIESGAVINECIVGDYTRISGIAELDRKIIFGSKCIDPSGSALDIAEHDIGWIVDDVRKKAELTDTHHLLMEMAASR
jgi:mannose-1-phosphate guanylyltransferase